MKKQIHLQCYDLNHCPEDGARTRTVESQHKET
jgi:hypothetical protein